MKKQLLIPIFLLLSLITKPFAQQKFDKIDFTEVDKFARSVKSDDDLERLTKSLTSPYSEDILKLRSIFIWITENIEYDIEAFNHKKYMANINCANPQECAEKWKDWEDEKIKTALTSKKAVCNGYAVLLKRMCKIADVQCEVVSGYSKTKPYEIGIPLSVDHDWNAVKLDSNYYFLDATWAAGGCFRDAESDKLTKFKKSYDNYYWLTPNDDFLRNHYPANKKWLFKDGYTKEMFFNAPIYSPLIISKMHLLSPNSGVLFVKGGDTVHFKFTDEEMFNYIQVNYTGYMSPSLPHRRLENNEVVLFTKDSLALQRAHFIPFTHKGNVYEFDYVIPQQTIYFLELLLDFRRAIKFNVNYQY